MTNYVIETWFPTGVFVEDDLLTESLSTFEDKIKTVRKEQGVIRGSIQSVESTHKTFDQLHTLEEFSNLSEMILNRAKLFAKELGYTNRFDMLHIDNMWSNISYEGDYLFPHTHSDSVISGAFYVKSPSNSKIKFFSNHSQMITPPDQMNSPLSYEYASYDCQPGRLLLFKSDTKHGTEKQPAGEKIVISFNLSFRRY